MVKSFKFLFQFVWVNLAAMFGFAAIVTVGAFATGVPDGANNLFRNYFGGFPFCVLIMLYLFAFALCTSNLNMGLSFGAKRRDFFWAIQAVLLVYTLASWGLQAFMSSIPIRFGWANVDSWTVLMNLGNVSPLYYPLVLMSLMSLGCLVGLVFIRSKIWGVVLMVASMLVFIAALVLLLLASDKTIHLWGDLPGVLTLIMVVILAVSEIFIWRTVNRSVVR